MFAKSTTFISIEDLNAILQVLATPRRFLGINQHTIHINEDRFNHSFTAVTGQSLYVRVAEKATRPWDHTAFRLDKGKPEAAPPGQDAEVMEAFKKNFPVHAERHIWSNCPRDTPV